MASFQLLENINGIKYYKDVHVFQLGRKGVHLHEKRDTGVVEKRNEETDISFRERILVWRRLIEFTRYDMLFYRSFDKKKELRTTSG